MASNGSKRVLVQLRRAQSMSYQPAAFEECVLGVLGLEGEGQVECHLKDNNLYLQPPNLPATATTDAPTTPNYTLMHPPFCPCHHFANTGREVDAELRERGVAVGSVVLVESSDGRLLLTRRAAHMRTFPNTWVPPGGHIEDGESLEAAVLRELEEETGLSVTEAERETFRILGLWESVYPPLLALGDPRRHHIVVYLHLKLQGSSIQLQSQLKLCPDEVDAAAWLSKDMVKMSVWSEMPNPELDANNLIPVTLVNRQGDQVEGTIEASFLVNAKQLEEKKERLSTGSRFAMSLWLQQHESSQDEGGLSQKELYGKWMMKSEELITPKPKM